MGSGRLDLIASIIVCYFAISVAAAYYGNETTADQILARAKRYLVFNVNGGIVKVGSVNVKELSGNSYRINIPIPCRL